MELTSKERKELQGASIADASKPTRTVQQIMAKYDKSSVYVKRALQKGWLAGHKKLMEGTQVYQWVAYVADVEAWRKSAEAHKASKARFTGSERDMNDLQAFLKNAKPAQVEALRKSLESKAH